MGHNSFNDIVQPDFAPIDDVSSGELPDDAVVNKKREEIQEANRVFQQLVDAGVTPKIIEKGATERLDLELPYEVRLAQTAEYMYPEITGEIVEQQLVAAIRLGGPNSEMFGIVKTLSPKSEYSEHNIRFAGYDIEMIVTEFGGRSQDGKITSAKAIGVLNSGSPIEIGRNHQEGLGEFISRNHLKIEKLSRESDFGAVDYGINISDNNSANGTELFVGDGEHIADLDAEIWAPDTEHVKKLLDQSKSANEEAGA